MAERELHPLLERGAGNRLAQLRPIARIGGRNSELPQPRKHVGDLPRLRLRTRPREVLGDQQPHPGVVWLP